MPDFPNASSHIVLDGFIHMKFSCQRSGFAGALLIFPLPSPSNFSLSDVVQAQ